MTSMDGVYLYYLFTMEKCYTWIASVFCAELGVSTLGAEHRFYLIGESRGNQFWPGFGSGTRFCEHHVQTSLNNYFSVV